MRRAFAVAGLLAVLGAWADVGSARGGTVGITITGGYRPVNPDPPWDYIFDVYLDPGFEVDRLNFFTVEDLVGVTSGSLSSQPPPNLPAYGWTPTPAAEAITWTFVGNTPILNPNPVGSNLEVDLGQFIVQTTENFPNGPPVPPGTLIHYTFEVTHLGDGPADGSGSFPIVLLGVPEPSSIVLLALGAALSAIAARRRSRNTITPRPC